MIRYGWEPPWEGESASFGRWIKGEEMWDGSGYMWRWNAPRGTIARLADIINNFYLPKIQTQLNQEVLFAQALLDYDHSREQAA